MIDLSGAKERGFALDLAATEIERLSSGFRIEPHSLAGDAERFSVRFISRALDDDIECIISVEDGTVDTLWFTVSADVPAGSSWEEIIDRLTANVRTAERGEGAVRENDEGQEVREGTHRDG